MLSVELFDLTDDIVGETVATWNRSGVVLYVQFPQTNHRVQATRSLTDIRSPTLLQQVSVSERERENTSQTLISVRRSLSHCKIITEWCSATALLNTPRYL